MKQQNFTMFTNENGYTSDYDITDHSTLSPSGQDRISKRMAKNANERLMGRLRSNEKGHKEYRRAILSGEVIDPSGEYVKETMERVAAAHNAKKIKSKIDIIDGKIKYIESLGGMSHTKSGRLRVNFQRQVNELLQQREKMT